MTEAVTPEKLWALARYDISDPNHVNLPAEARDTLRAASDLIAEQADKIEGLTCDLRMAVETAYKRGATEWTRLNYPKWFADFQDAEDRQ